MSLVVNVYGYDVHYTKKSNGIIMYFAADIVKMFNTRNNQKKRFTHCLENKDTHDLIKVISENSKKITEMPHNQLSGQGTLTRQITVPVNCR